jgi:diketogulonate reductase-like aldo/keto reductase
MNTIASKRDCTPAQVALAWGMARGTAVIPKSSHVNRIVENFGARDCPLSAVDVKMIEGIESKWIKRFNNPSRGWGVDLFEGLDGV